MTGIEWNLEALYQDARAWQCVAEKLDAARTLMSEARLSDKDFMSFLPSSATASASVATAISDLRGFASDGADRTLQGARVLREVAGEYQANEDQARRELDGLWEPEDR